MAFSQTLLIFARQPHFGVGKSRLAARTSPWHAWQFQRRQILALGKLAQDPRWSCRFVWEHEQGPGDLGQRLMRALKGPVGPKRLIIGADTLDVHADHIARAFRGLESAPYVLGPSPDGGFWAIGSRCPVRLGPVQWSTPQAFVDTQTWLGTVGLAETLSDLD